MRRLPDSAYGDSQTDLLVIGSGAGGAPAAWAAAKAGLNVTILDRGPWYESQDFAMDEIRVARRDFFVPSPDRDPHVVATPAGEELSQDGWIALCVGGGTVHMSGFFYRFLPTDFRLREHMGSVPGASIADWPLELDELEPYYDRVADIIGLSGPSTPVPGVPARHFQFPLPPVKSHPAGQWLDSAARGLGLSTFETPRAVLSRPHRGRSACAYHAVCGSYGCSVRAKGSTLDTFIPEALETGRVQLLPEARAMRIETDGQRQAKAVIYRRPDGSEHRIKCRALVVACSAVESARLLLLSTGPGHAEGLGNATGQVGANVMFSTLSKAHGTFERGKDPARDQVLGDKTPFLGRSIYDYYTPKGGPKKAGLLNFLWPSGGPIYQSEQVALGGDKPLFGHDLKKALKRYWQQERQVDCECFGEYLPTPGTRVVLDSTTQDDAGSPAARIEIDRHPHDAEVSRFLAGKAEKVIKAAGADRTWTSNIGGRTMHLPLGGCRMGENAENSVVDRNGKVHGVDNVWVSDGSVFPSSGGVPPTFTIMANALRIGEQIVKARGATIR